MMASFLLLFAAFGILVFHAHGWSQHSAVPCIVKYPGTSSSRGGGAKQTRPTSAFGYTSSTKGRTTTTTTITSLNLHTRADVLRSVGSGSAGAVTLSILGIVINPSRSWAAAAAETKKQVNQSPQDAATAALKSSLDTLEREKKKMDKDIKKQTKVAQKEVQKIDKKVQKETKAGTKAVKKEIKKMDKTVQKTTKKIDKTVKKEAEKARKEVDKGAKVVEREAKKIGDAVGKGTQSLVGGSNSSSSSGAGSPSSGGIDVSKLKTCNDPRGKMCL